jgi:hypothetical protein
VTQPVAPQAAKPRTSSTAGLPAPTPRQSSVSSAPPPQQQQPAAAPPAALPGDLPVLEPDGVTLRFGSADQYRTQHKANIQHGGIIVRASPLAIGTQKFLGIEVPGRERYTVSARVTFIGEGTVGFVIDSFAIHKAQLKSFTDA